MVGRPDGAQTGSSQFPTEGTSQEGGLLPAGPASPLLKGLMSEQLTILGNLPQAGWGRNTKIIAENSHVVVTVRAYSTSAHQLGVSGQGEASGGKGPLPAGA